METVFVGVGSNIDAERNVSRALAALQNLAIVEASSTFYWSAPFARPDQAKFLNGVWQVRTEMEARAFKFDVLRVIEHELGRRRSSDKHAARPIDLDLLLFGTDQIDESDLKVPDPEICQRNFLWQPLRELAEQELTELGLRPPAAFAQDQAALIPADMITKELKSQVSK